MSRKRTVVCFERARKKDVHLHILNAYIHTITFKTTLKHDITDILFNLCQTLTAQFTCKASEEQPVECGM